MKKRTIKKSYKHAHVKSVKHHKTIVKKHVVHYAKKFCPNCGKQFTGSGTLCKDCLVPDFRFKDIEIILCNSCHSYNHKNKWTKYKDLDMAIKKIAAENIKAKVIIRKLDHDMKEKINGYKAGIKTELILDVNHKHEHYDIPAKLSVTLCNKCSKKGTQYFDSILQLRNCTDQVLDFARNEVMKQHKKGIFINKEVPLDKYSIKDIDLYLTNQTYTKTLAEKIKKNFGGMIKKNAKHFSANMQTSKVLYRLNLLLLLPEYAKNDVIKKDDHLYKIISVGEKIHVEDLRTKSKTLLPHKDSYDILKPVIFQVIKRYPEIELLDPNTYYQTRLMNPDPRLEINQKIKVVIDGGEAWMI